MNRFNWVNQDGGVLMKNFLLAGCAVAALAATPVLAADMPVKAPPVAAPVYNWTGCYIGSNVGGKWGQSSHTTAVNGTGADVFGNMTVPPFVAPTPPVVNRFGETAQPIVNTLPIGTNATGTPFRVEGYVTGGQVGCQFHGGFVVIGIEADGDWARVNGDKSEIAAFGTRSFTCIGPPATCFGTQISADFFARTEERWIATARARVGFTFSNNRGLLYATGGGAWAGVRVSEFMTSNCCNTPFVGAVETRTLAGWTAGGGLEWVFTGPWTGKVEYLFISLNNHLFLNQTLPAGDPFLPRNVNVRESMVRIGLNYRFIPF